MDGTEKCKLLVIGKSANPRCFKDVKSLPVDYKSNRKAWMTSEILTDWLSNFDGRKVLLIVDNVSSHKQTQHLRSIELLFHPSNTTCRIQPCD